MMMPSASAPVVVVSEQEMEDVLTRVYQTRKAIFCSCIELDKDDVYQIKAPHGQEVLISYGDNNEPIPPDIQLWLKVQNTEQPNMYGIQDSQGNKYFVECHFVNNGRTQPIKMHIIPRAADVFSRVRGIFETDVLQGRTVCIFGVGSGGSFVARELAKCGVGSFALVDSDRLELGNLSRHECGLRDIGRLKVNCVRDVILAHHPGAKVNVAAIHISGDTRDDIRKLIADSDVVICATDNRESRLIVNRICIQEGKPTIFGGVFLRAVGGQVLRVIPELTPCYQCFVTALPMEAADNEISSDADAGRLSYTDRPMPIEPGLSSDIIPVALHIVKLALVELLRDSTTSLSSLREDLVAPWYLWINRRDPSTIYSNWEPLEDNIDGMRVLRWYGIVLDRNHSCPACGASAEHRDLDVQFFATGQ